MQWIITIIALLLAIPTYGISLLFLVWYTVSTGKDRRSQIFYPIIREAYLRPGESFVTNKVHYEAAEQFAKEHDVGAIATGGNSVAADVTLGNERVSVWFGKGPYGELIVSVENTEAQEKRLLGDLVETKLDKEQIKDITIIGDLMWENVSVAEDHEMDWYDALEYAKNLRVGGYDDWRLPTSDELGEVITLCGVNFIKANRDKDKYKKEMDKLITGESKGDSLFDILTKPKDEDHDKKISPSEENKENKAYQACYKEKGFRPNSYWSSSIYYFEPSFSDKNIEEKEWTVDFYRGYESKYLFSRNPSYVRCVRDIE